MPVLRLTLTNFRNYHAASVSVTANTIVLVGPNGAGKTNLIEAISFLAPGRGLRRATIEEVAFFEGDSSWAVAAEIEGALGLATLGTGIERGPEAGAPTQRKYRIDREPIASATAFADHIRVVWLVPAMDALFVGAPSERRRFLDRLVLAVDAEHGSRVNALERALRSRNRLLEEPRPDAHWLDAVEHETAELAVAVAGLRVETVRRLEAVLKTRDGSAFPPAEIALDGWMEQLIPAHPAAEIEERYRAVLRDNRGSAWRTGAARHASLDDGGRSGAIRRGHGRCGDRGSAGRTIGTANEETAIRFRQIVPVSASFAKNGAGPAGNKSPPQVLTSRNPGGAGNVRSGTKVLLPWRSLQKT